MSKYIIKDNYNIEYNITDTGLTISIYNEDNSNKYSVTETRDKYNAYFTIGMNIFDIINKSFINGLFVITDNIDNIIIAFNTIKETIRCDIVKDDNTQMVSSDFLTIASMAKKINELELQIKRLEKQDKFVFIGQKRINRHKKHLILYNDRYCNFLAKHNIVLLISQEFSVYYQTHKIFKDYDGNLTNIQFFLPEKERDQQILSIDTYDHITNDDLDTPILLDLQFIDIEDILQLDLDILTLSWVKIKNVNLLRHFKGRHLNIIFPQMDSYNLYNDAKKHNLDYAQILNINTKTFCKQLRDAISQLTNLVTLTILGAFYGQDSRLLKFKYDFFKNMKSLKSLIIYTGTVVKYDTSREIDIYYYGGGGSTVSRNKHG